MCTSTNISSYARCIQVHTYPHIPDDMHIECIQERDIGVCWYFFSNHCTYIASPAWQCLHELSLTHDIFYLCTHTCICTMYSYIVSLA